MNKKLIIKNSNERYFSLQDLFKQIPLSNNIM